MAASAAARTRAKLGEEPRAERSGHEREDLSPPAAPFATSSSVGFAAAAMAEDPDAITVGIKRAAAARG